MEVCSKRTKTILNILQQNENDNVTEARLQPLSKINEQTVASPAPSQSLQSSQKKKRQSIVNKKNMNRKKTRNDSCDDDGETGDKNAFDISPLSTSDIAVLNPAFVSKCDSWLRNESYAEALSTASPELSAKSQLVPYTPSSTTTTASVKDFGLRNTSNVIRNIKFGSFSAPALPLETPAITEGKENETPVAKTNEVTKSSHATASNRINSVEETTSPPDPAQTDVNNSQKATKALGYQNRKGDTSSQSKAISKSDSSASHTPLNGDIGKKAKKTLGTCVGTSKILNSSHKRNRKSTESGNKDPPPTAANPSVPGKISKGNTSFGSKHTAPEDSANLRQFRERKPRVYVDETSDEELFLEDSDCEDSVWLPDASKVPDSVSDLDDSDSEQVSASQVGCDNSTQTPVAVENNSANDSSELECSEAEEADPEKVTRRGIRKENKIRRNTGQEYKTKSGKIRKARQCQPLPVCKAKWCKIRELSEEDRNNIFQEYWGLGSFDKRCQYVSSRVTKNSVMMRRQRDEQKKERTYSLQYCLIHNEQRLPVTKNCFLSTLDENDRFVRGLMERRSTTMQVPDDSRGKHAPSNKFPEHVREEVVTHIKKFPAYVSHYSRRHTTQLYLGSHLSVAKMHQLFLEEGGTKMSYNSYLDIFNSMKPKLKFKAPHVDTCVTCDSFMNSIKSAQSPDEEQTLQEQFSLHKNKADFAYECKRKDKEKAKNSSKKIATIVFDLEQVLPCPYLTSGNVFYLRQLSVYNLTVFESTLKQAFNFMWHEAISGRGADEIASCILTFIHEYLPLSIKHLIMYSDTCSGQNKNSLMLAALTICVQQHPSLELIDQKFLVSGHTHLECDQAHHQIETRKKNTNVALHHPQNYFDLVKEVGPVGKKFKVREMKLADIFSFEPIVKGANAPLVWRKTDTDGNPFLFSEVEWFRLERSSPGIVQYKKSLHEEEPFLSVNWKRKRNEPFPEIDLFQKKNTQSPISSAKKQDLLKLLDQINPLYHEFYRNLPCDNDIMDEDPDLPAEFDVANEFLE